MWIGCIIHHKDIICGFHQMILVLSINSSDNCVFECFVQVFSIINHVYRQNHLINFAPKEHIYRETEMAVMHKEFMLHQ